MTRKQIFAGFKEFRRLLIERRDYFKVTPMLLVESEADQMPRGEEATRKQQKASEVFQHVHLVCTSVGLRTASFHPSATHFPFPSDIEKALEFAQRIGTSTVVGVGSSSAMELSKAISGDFEQVILVPGDWEATLFSNTLYALVMDTKEQALVLSEGGKKVETPCSIILPDSNAMFSQSAESIRYMLHAALVLALDVLMRGENDEEALSKAQSLVQLIQKHHDDRNIIGSEGELQQAFLWNGETLSFGISPTSNQCRSIPLSLATSLVTTTFPDYTVTEIMSCLLPGMLAVFQETSYHDLLHDISEKVLPRCPRFTQSPGDETQINTLISHVHSNGALWNCRDVDDNLIDTVLRSSIS